MQGLCSVSGSVGRMSLLWCGKHASFAPFVYQKRSIYQDRLGINIGKTQKEKRFLQGCVAPRRRLLLAGDEQGRGVLVGRGRLRPGECSGFFESFVNNAPNILPRQAWDKRTVEKTQKPDRFLTGLEHHDDQQQARCAKRLFCDAILYTKNHQFTRTGSGQT